MKIYDISQEVFGSAVYPGDPAPEKKEVLRIENGAVCNLTAFGMCAHNGTHVDAPFHFYADGKTIERIPLEKMVGMCYVALHKGDLSADHARAILDAARAFDPDAAKRILLKGDATVTLQAAEVFADADIFLLGCESQSVGDAKAPMPVHMVLLGKEVVLLEGVRLNQVPENNVYLLNAAPISLAGSDGAPCRAILIKL